MECSELTAAALIARPVETEHHAGGKTIHHYEIDARFDPNEWGLALAVALKLPIQKILQRVSWHFALENNIREVVYLG